MISTSMSHTPRKPRKPSQAGSCSPGLMSMWEQPPSAVVERGSVFRAAQGTIPHGPETAAPTLL
jgi:hypothetical protein